MLSEGSAIPTFSVKDQAGTARDLGEFAGRWLVVWFYSKDATPG